MEDLKTSTSGRGSKQPANGMRRFIIITPLAAFAAAAILILTGKGEMPLPKKLELVMKTTDMDTYHDKLFGYTVRYPSFFEQIPDSLIDEDGCCRFRYWNEVEIEQSVFVSPNPYGLTAKQGMDSLATIMHATEKRCKGDTFFLSGPLYVGGSKISGHRFHAKYVGHRKLWFVQSLTYPEECTKAMQRLIRQIDAWRVWEDERPCPVGKRLYKTAAR